MKLELRFGGLSVIGTDGDRFQLHTEPGTTASAAELFAIAQFLEAVTKPHAPQQIKPLAVAPVATVQTLESPAVSRWVGREPAEAGVAPLPVRTGAVSYLAGKATAADHMVIAERESADAAFVPRANSQTEPVRTVPQPAARLVQADPSSDVKKPGRPVGGPPPRADLSPGRPRSIPLPPSLNLVLPRRDLLAASAATAAFFEAGANKPTLPGRPRTVPVGYAPAAVPGLAIAAMPAAALDPASALTPNEAIAVVRPVTKLPAQPAPKVRTGRLVDQFDGWMKNNPGPRSRDELIQVGIDAGWLGVEDAKRVFNMCMSRERDLFIRTVDGSTETYIRRAEALAPSSAPGKVIRRRPPEGTPPAAN
jgi:hypothetical protein